LRVRNRVAVGARHLRSAICGREYAIIGGPGDGGPGENNVVGAAWVYTRSGSVWSQQGGKLVGTGAVGGSAQGQSVAISADGTPP